MWKSLQKLMAPTQNYIMYRNFFKTVEGSTFPYFGTLLTFFATHHGFQLAQPPFSLYLGLYLSDLCVIQEKYPTRLAGGKINFSKMRMLAGVMTDLQKFQTTVMYPFGENPMVQKFLDDNGNAIMDEDELYAHSKQCEGSEDLSISRAGKLSLKSPRHRKKGENLSIEKFDFNAPRTSQS